MVAFRRHILLLPLDDCLYPALAPVPGPLGDAASAAILDRLPRRLMLAVEEGLRLSLAGAQAKSWMVLVDGCSALPAAGQPTTHIVKPEIARFPGLVANVGWCMALAKHVGLDVAPAVARNADGRRYLLVTRDDRQAQHGAVIRLHQEDAGQALGVVLERKYAAEGGPAFSDLFADAQLCADPCARRAEAGRCGDLQSGDRQCERARQDFSFLLDVRGPRLAPLYNLLSTIAWPELNPRLAMRIGRREPSTNWTAMHGRASFPMQGLPCLRRRGTVLIEAVERSCADVSGPTTCVSARSCALHLSVGAWSSQSLKPQNEYLYDLDGLTIS